MASYIGRHSELYDVIYSDKPYTTEVAFIDNQLTSYGLKKNTRILELACGTGTHAILLEKFGYKITGSDYSEDMIRQAKKKADTQGSKVNFVCADMRKLPNFKNRFDAIICLFDSIGYVQDNESIKQVFSNVNNYLVPGGLFIMEFWHAGAMIRNYEPLRVKKFNLRGSELLRISETSMDIEKQLCSVHYKLYELNENGTYKKIEETQVNRFFLVQEMQALLNGSGLNPVSLHDGFTDKTTITSDTWHVVAVCKKIL